MILPNVHFSVQKLAEKFVISQILFSNRKPTHFIIGHYPFFLMFGERWFLGVIRVQLYSFKILTHASLTCSQFVPFSFTLEKNSTLRSQFIHDLRKWDVFLIPRNAWLIYSLRLDSDKQKEPPETRRSAIKSETTETTSINDQVGNAKHRRELSVLVSSLIDYRIKQ